MSQIKVFYKSDMVRENGGFSPSSFKPLEVVKDWENLFSDNISIKDFNSLEKEDFFKVHNEQYVEGIFQGTIINGYGVMSKQFAKVFCATSGSLLQASQTALKEKVAVSPSSGFHHARWSKSEGFCTFNGLVLTSVMMKEQNLVQKIGILDFDMHYGNGTDEIIKKYKLDYIIHYTAGKKYDLHYPFLNFLKPIIKKLYNKQFKQKTAIKSSSSVDVIQKQTVKPILRQMLLAKRGKGKDFINKLDTILEKFKDCDLIIYQAGADQHIDDPYGGLLTYEQMQERDRKVFQFAKDKNIPIVWNLAGGYQKDNNGTIEPVLKCHRNTMAECIKIYT